MGRKLDSEAAAAQPVSQALSAADLGVVVDGVARADLPRLEPRPPFLLMFHRELWQVMGGEVIPAFGQLTLRAGVAGVTYARKGSDDLAVLRSKVAYAERGWTVLPLDCAGPGTSYLYRPAPGVHLLIWERAWPGSTKTTIEVDRFVAWCRALVEAGTIPRPQPYVLQALRNRAHERQLRLEDLSRTRPSVLPRLDEARREVETLDRELEALRPEPVPVLGVSTLPTVD